MKSLHIKGDPRGTGMGTRTTMVTIIALCTSYSHAKKAKQKSEMKSKKTQGDLMEKLKACKAVNQKKNFKNSNVADADLFQNESVVSVAPPEHQYILRLVKNFQNIFDQPIIIFCSAKILAFQFLLECTLLHI